MYTYTSREIILMDQDLILSELNKLCDKALNGIGNIATDYNNIYKSYRYDVRDNTILTELLWEQNIYPSGYLCSIINGDGGLFKAHRDKQRKLSIMYIKTGDKSTTNHYYPKKYNNNTRFYNDDEMVLAKSTVLEQNKLYLFNHQTIHSVTGINSQRCNISINLI